LSTNAVYNSSDRLLGTFEHAQSLPAGAALQRSGQVTIPPEYNGTFYLLVVADDPNRLVEPAAEGNNTAARIVTINLSPSADLAVTHVAAPALVIGDPARMNVSWTVSNVGEAVGRTTNWTDVVIASTDAVV